ncbi:hypothetical protein, conserved [Eimeria acervulina]|uniref:Uncharacterized protein n=1 Tax=Eimeria acervulina TaxID=5801 RepID=U6GJC8_EIMAC|nr:hypothetical protein, conserved [Eimeria acervulina]CDI78694.1 hypothetical protein, conserved [Eimeria acervulina]
MATLGQQAAVSRREAAEVEATAARLKDMHARKMYSSRGPWKRLLQKLYIHRGALIYIQGDPLISAVSAASAYVQANACMQQPAHNLAAALLQELADSAAPAATAAAAGSAAAAAASEAAAAGSAAAAGTAPQDLPFAALSSQTRLLLLLLLQPFIHLSEDSSKLTVLQSQALLPIIPECVQALTAAAAAAAAEGASRTGARAAGEAAASTAAAESASTAAAGAAAAGAASLFPVVSSKPFAVLELLLSSRGPPNAQLQQARAPLEVLLQCAGPLMMSANEGEEELNAAFVCSQLVLLLASGETNTSSSNSSSSSSNNNNSCSSITNSSSSSSNNNNSSSSSSNSSSSSSNSRESAALDWFALCQLCLRAVLRSPLHAMKGASIELSFAAIDNIRAALAAAAAAETAATAAGAGEAAAGGQEERQTLERLLQLAAAAQAHVLQAAAAKAAQLEPADVMHVVAATLRSGTLGTRWFSSVMRRACNLRDCFSQEERTVLQTAIKRLLSSLSQKQLLDRTQRGVDPPFACMQVLPGKASIGAAKPPKELPMGAPRGPSGLDRGDRERQQRQELLQLLKIIARLRLFELPPRANVSWSSGRSQFSLMV